MGIETLNGIRYRVRRNYGEKPLVLGDNGEPVDIEIGRGNIFSAEIYSQNQIEDIANDPVFQLKLIDKFVADQIKEIGSQIQTCQRELDANAVDILKLRKEVSDLKDQIAELPEVSEKLKAFKMEEKGEEAKALQRESEHRTVRDQERRSLEGLKSTLSNVADSLQNIASSLADEVAEYFNEDILSGPNSQLFSDTKVFLEDRIGAILQNLNESTQVAQNAQKQVEEKASQLSSCPEYVCTSCARPREKVVTGRSQSAFNIRVRDKRAGRLEAKWGKRVKASEAEALNYDEQEYPGLNLRKYWKAVAQTRGMPTENVVAHIAGGHTGLSKGISNKPTAEWKSCGCNVGFEPGIVFDPFAGAGTTLVVAKKLGRRFLGCELNRDYVEMANQRIAQAAL